MASFLKRINRLLSFLLENTKRKPILIRSTKTIKCNGKESYHNGNFNVKGRGLLEIGSFCAIGEDVTVILSNHDYSRICMQYTFYNMRFSEKIPSEDIVCTKIENDVWIGDRVIILPGIHIATGAIIGAGSVVTKNVEPYTIVAGNPSKKIKMRFSEEKINELLLSKWWEWDEDTIKKNRGFFI